MIITKLDIPVIILKNAYQNRVRYEDMFFQEFIPPIDATFRTRAAIVCRAGAGLSMGGWGTLVYALRHPEMFTAAFRAAVWTEKEIINTPELAG